MDSSEAPVETTTGNKEEQTMSTPSALEQQLAQVQALAPQSPVPAQVMQQVLPDPSNPQMPEAATLPGMEQALPPPQQPSEFNQLTQPQAPQMQPQQPGIAQQPPQQVQQQEDPRLNMMHGRLRAANDEIKLLKQQVEMSQMQTGQPSPQTPAPTAKVTPAEITDAECIDHFGKAYFDEWGPEATKQQLATMKNMMASMQPVQSPQTNNVDQVKKLSTQVFLGELARLVPNYQTIESNPQFDLWLTSNMDQLSGMYYNDWLNDAYSEGDAPRAAHIFQMFLGQGAGSPVHNQQPQAPQQQVYQQPYNGMQVNPQLQQAVMPSTTGAPMAQVSQAPTMSKADCLRALAELPNQGLSPLEMSTKQAELTTLMKTIQSTPQMQTMQPAQPGW